MRNALLSFCLLWFFSSSVFAGQGANVQNLYDRVSATLNQAGFEGTALVADKGTIVFEQGFGLANREWEVPNTIDTRFRVGSITKAFTAILVMQQVEAGTLDLDKTIADYLSDFPAERARVITLQQLLTHRSGLANFLDLPGWFQGRYIGALSDDEFLKALMELDVKSKPGTERYYSNTNYFILGLILEKVTGQAYGDLLATQITDPLKMTQTDDFEWGAVVPKLANDYMLTGKGSFCRVKSGSHCKGAYMNFARFRASGSIHTSAKDLLKLDQALYGTNLLGDQAKDMMFAGPYAWTVGGLPLGDRQISVQIADGGINGYTALLVRFPEESKSIILLNNNGLGYNALVGLAVEIAGGIIH